MSYELFFKPRNGQADPNEIAAYFSSRNKYEVSSSQAWYQNEDTGVYFVFESRDEEDAEGAGEYPIALNVNYFRPSYFIREAEPEVTAFVRRFDMVVSDPQVHGMGEGEYDPELLISGWNDGNELGYASFLREPQYQNVASLPTAVLLKAWSWSLMREQLQSELGNSKFVPKIMFIRLEGIVKTAAVWPDGLPIAVPDVDCLIVPRKDLAPRGMFGRTEDRTIVALNEALPMLRKHGAQHSRGMLVLNYDQRTEEIVKYVRSLPVDKREIEWLAADDVLDRELVAKYVPQQAR